MFDFLRIAWGGGNSLPTAVLGAFPIIFGLSFWQSVAATLVGVLLGALILAPMAIFGPINGTNNAVSSSAHFGVVGRIVGSYLSLLTAICFSQSASGQVVMLWSARWCASLAADRRNCPLRWPMLFLPQRCLWFPFMASA